MLLKVLLGGLETDLITGQGTPKRSHTGVHVWMAGRRQGF